MWTVGNLFAQLTDHDHLAGAAKAAVRGKRRRPEVAWFLFRREQVLRELGASLRDGRWEPHGFDVLLLHDPKPRVIARAPLEDRIVHTAVTQALEPMFRRMLTEDAFACRPGFGTHRAVLRLLELVQRFRWVVHLDVRSYFPSIDVERLRGLLARRVHDDRFLAVVDRILAAGRGLYDAPQVRAFARMDPDWPPPGRGLPIGSLTSQVFASHVYLAGLDHFVRRELKLRGYVRYVDDLYLFADRRATLRLARVRVAEWLLRERSLRLKHPCARILSCRGHLDALGHRVRRGGVEPLPGRPLTRLAKRIRRFVHGRGTEDRAIDLDRSVAATVGHVLFGC